MRTRKRRGSELTEKHIHIFTDEKGELEMETLTLKRGERPTPPNKNGATLALFPKSLTEGIINLLKPANDSPMA